MASINVVFDTLKAIANKDQKGFLTPALFNELAPIAQIKIYNRLFNRLKDAHRNSRANFDPGRDKSLHKRIKEDLSVFQRVIVLTRVNGAFEYPENFSRAIAVTTNGAVVLGQSTRVPLEMCYDEDKVDRILRNKISRPTDNFPLAVMSENIEVYPTSINRIRLNYYKRPEGIDSLTGEPVASQPFYNSTGILGSEEGFDPDGSVDFELPDHMIDEIVSEMSEMIGIHLRDTALMQSAAMDQQQIQTEQTFG